MGRILTASAEKFAGDLLARFRPGRAGSDSGIVRSRRRIRMAEGLIFAAVMMGVYLTVLIVIAAALERKHRR